MEKKSAYALFFKYLTERPLLLKFVDMLLILAVSFGISTAYILATNFDAIFLEPKVREYQRLLDSTSRVAQVNTILDTLLNELDANRVGIYMFHNGTHGIGDIPFFYYSQTFEVTSSGASSELQNNQRIHIGIDANIGLLFQDGFVETDIDLNTPFGHLLQSQGIQQHYRYALIGLDNQLLGFVALEYLTTESRDVQQIEDTMHRFAQALSGALVGLQ